MNRSKDVDAFTQHVMSRIDQNVFKTLNLVQLEAIRSAISANAPYKKHPIDIRITIPFFFMKFYLVVLIGKDRRLATRDKEKSRIENTKALSWLVSAYIGASLLIPLLILVLYLVKSALGIDIFPEKHLWDFF